MLTTALGRTGVYLTVLAGSDYWTGVGVGDGGLGLLLVMVVGVGCCGLL